MTKQRTHNGIIERMCRYCEAWYPLGRFAKGGPNNLDGLRPKCKLCYAGDYQSRYRGNRKLGAA